MKKSISLVILLILGLFLTSCEKEENSNYTIKGEWIWLKSYGGFSGNALYTPENTGITKKLIFLNDSVSIIANTDTSKFEYFLSREESILLQKEFDFLTINYKYKMSNPDSIFILPIRYMIITLNDSLFLDEDVYDGFGHEYSKK